MERDDSDMFTVLGEALLDLVQPTSGGPYVARPGGGPLNIAVGLRRWGHPTHLMARISTRPLGDVIRNYAVRNDLDLTACASTSDPATLAFATLDEAGGAAYDFYVEGTADWGWTDAELGAVPPGTRVFHTGSLTAALAPGAGAVLQLARRLRNAGQVLVSFDPNVRPGVIRTRAAAVQRIAEYVGAAHVVKASEEDLAWLYPGRNIDDVLTEMATTGPDLVVVTRGAGGCVARMSNGLRVEVPANHVRVVDTIGAGDAFMSGLLSGLADAGALSSGVVSDLQPAALRSVLERATAVAALTCQRTGADPPTRSEYAAYLERR
jgi:fructokinase